MLYIPRISRFWRNLLVTTLFCANAQAEMYLELGIGLVSQEMSQPEYIVESPMGRVTFGNTIGDWSIELEHISSIPQREKGAGLNILWINRRFVIE